MASGNVDAEGSVNSNELQQPDAEAHASFVDQPLDPKVLETNIYGSVIVQNNEKYVQDYESNSKKLHFKKVVKNETILSKSVESYKT